MPLSSLKIVALTIALAICSYLYLQKRQQRKVEQAFAIERGCRPVLPRVPYKWPFALDLLKIQFQAYFSGHSLEALTPYITIAGTIRLELWGVTGYITTDPENIEAVLSTHFEDYIMGTRTLALFPFLREGIFTQDGHPWKRSREIIRRQFVRVHKQSPQILSSHVNDLLSSIQRADGFEIVDLKPYFFDYTLGTTTKLLFGESLDTLSNEERDTFRDAFDYASWCCGIRIRLADLAVLYNPPKFRNACKLVSDWAGHFSDKALKYRDQFGEEKAYEKYAFIIDLWKEMGDPVLVKDQLLHILIAGRDSTACLLSWTLFHLVRNRDVLEQLRKELSSVPVNVELTREQITKLTFLRCCLNETLRLYPQLPLNLRYTNKATVLPRGGGPDGQSPILIPKGSGIGWSTYHLHRNEAIYGSDARIYRPQRWESGELIKKAGLGAGFVDFNGGPRTCLGKDFALMEASYAIIRVLQAFPGIRLPPGSPNEPVGAEKQSLSMLVAPQNGVDVLLS
ncbi:n-alkane-inducible cytochrome P450 [Melanomma pulvis-pyrius CBS 109.77]|uniref:N-alkane-inducible cytochrome P450 n=1 Tax=Melanomma pulvis-pyrius CBS 109.77 TaxID=1314802 RepID=A0A6A6XV39_9PLEO|nr:n-alkane-inducible cytochrome P450 [Melanomma pulvis-pyrius CBS 109.77]